MMAKKYLVILLIVAAGLMVVVALRGYVYQVEYKGLLFNAISAKHYDQVKNILTIHPDIKDSYLSDGWTALTMAAREGDSKMVRLLLEHGVNVNELEGGGNSALFWATQYGHVGLVERLLRAGANVDNKCGDCVGPQEVARTKGYAEILALLDQYSSGHRDGGAIILTH